MSAISGEKNEDEISSCQMSQSFEVQVFDSLNSYNHVLSPPTSIDKDTQTSNCHNNITENQPISFRAQKKARMNACVESMFATGAIASSSEQSQEGENHGVLVKVAESLLLLGNDNGKYCMSCDKIKTGVCPQHGNLVDNLLQTNAVLSLPTSMTIKESSIKGAGLGVFSLEVLEIDSMFGPMKGELLSFEEHEKRTDNSYVWEVYDEVRKCIIHYLDCVDESKSNWMRFVNCARYEEEQNLIAEQYGGFIFFKAYKKITPGQELLVWYGRPSNSCELELDNNSMESPVAVNRTKEVSPVSMEFLNGLLNSKNSKKYALPDTCYQCSNCQAMFSMLSYLERHQKHVCPVAGNFRCSLCPRTFGSIQAWKTHTRKCHDGSNEKKFKCMLCSRCFVEKGNLKTHLKSHLKIKDFACELCDSKFSRSTFLRNHVMTVHKKERPYICIKCGKSFGRQDSLTRHSKLHEDNKNETCGICGMKYHTTSNLYSHKRKIHPPTKTMTEALCGICNETFDDIVAHKAFVHSIKYKTQCHICNKKFLHINQHLRLHEREGQVEQCPICLQYYKSLNGHMKVHPMETKLFKKRISNDNIHGVASNEVVLTTS